MSGSLADLFNTQLTPVGEQLYRQAMPPGASQDYDMRGAWAQLGGNLPAQGAHFTDQFKKPNHPTFSAQSQYSTPARPGGNWAQVSNNNFGYPIRKTLFEGETAFFQKNPHVGGMAAEDGQIVLNPYSALSSQEQAAVARNEGARLFMRERQIAPQFNVTDEQKAAFAGTPYGDDLEAMRQTLVARIVSGDPSARATPAQTAEAHRLVPQLPGTWAFAPSQTNLSNFGQANMERYFNEVEPGNLLLNLGGSTTP